MRLSFAVSVVCSLLMASTAIGERVFPYKAYITAEEVYVRSGPGQSYYPTDKLEAGQEVEVYRHDPDGWYAIKPPEGSFAWVSARYLEAGVDDLAIVTADRVAARVGSRFSDIRDVIQVRLHKGEVVEVLDSKQTGIGATRATWYKISPPSGGFRWVFGKYVDTERHNDSVRKPNAAENRIAGRHVGDDSLDETCQAEPQPFVRQAIDDVVDDVHKPVAEPEPDSELVAPRGLSPEQYQAELDEIDMELSIMVSEEPTVWMFDDLRRRARLLLAQSETAVERGRARIFIGKVDRFADIKHRYDEVAAMHDRTERLNRQLAGLKQTNRLAGRLQESRDDRYDGTGQLTRVVSPRLDSPRYVLVDDRGDVQCYVSPVPGVNLRHYLGRHVGVTGTRGYMPEQNAHHIMAQHVSLLEGRVSR